METNPPQLTLTTDDETTRPLPTNVRIAQAMGWQVVNLSPVMLPHFILPDGETLFFDEFTPDLDPVSWQMVERWMVENFGEEYDSRKDAYAVAILNERAKHGYVTLGVIFNMFVAPLSIRCQAFLQAVSQ